MTRKSDVDVFMDAVSEAQKAMREGRKHMFAECDDPRKGKAYRAIGLALTNLAKAKRRLGRVR